MKTLWLHVYPCFKNMYLQIYFCIRSEEDKKYGAFFFYHGKINVNLQIQSTANADRILACRQVLQTDKEGKRVQKLQIIYKDATALLKAQNLHRTMR